MYTDNELNFSSENEKIELFGAERYHSICFPFLKEISYLSINFISQCMKKGNYKY
jgi:hypothetical protein